MTRFSPAVTATVRPLSADHFRYALPTAMNIYGAAMGYPADVLPGRGAIAALHASYPGFVAQGAFDSAGTLVGFGYGYTTQPDHWWHSEVSRALGPSQQSWLDNAFELSELHVLPQYQGAGIGRGLLSAITRDLPQRHVLLSTPDGMSPARHLYERSGFVALASQFVFSTDRRLFAIMGRRLPDPRV